MRDTLWIVGMYAGQEELHMVKH